jgi:hypothetical protein
VDAILQPATQEPLAEETLHDGQDGGAGGPSPLRQDVDHIGDRARLPGPNDLEDFQLELAQGLILRWHGVVAQVGVSGGSG